MDYMNTYLRWLDNEYAVNRYRKLAEECVVQVNRVQETVDEITLISSQNAVKWKMFENRWRGTPRGITTEISSFQKIEEMVQAQNRSDSEVRRRLERLESQVKALYAFFNPPGGESNSQNRGGEGAPPPPGGTEESRQEVDIEMKVEPLDVQQCESRDPVSSCVDRGGEENCAPPPPPGPPVRTVESRQDVEIEVNVDTLDVQQCESRDPVSSCVVPPTPDSIFSSTPDKNCDASGTKRGMKKGELVAEDSSRRRKKMKGSPGTTWKTPFHWVSDEKMAEKERSKAETLKGKRDHGASRSRVKVPNPGPLPARTVLNKRPFSVEAAVATGSLNAAPLARGCGFGNSTLPGLQLFCVGNNEAEPKRHKICKRCRKPFTNMVRLSKHKNACM